MCKKYVLLAVCAALVLTLIDVPDSCAKVRAVKTFDSKVWVKIDELEGDPWSSVAPLNESEIDNMINVGLFMVHYSHSPSRFLTVLWDTFNSLLKPCKYECKSNAGFDLKRRISNEIRQDRNQLFNVQVH